MSKVDWKAIKREYVNTSISYRDIAKKYDVSFNTLKDHAVGEGWADARKKRSADRKATATVCSEPTKLTEKQALFCLFYSKSLNGTRAYSEAYPDCEYATARRESSKLLTKPYIRDEIKRLKEQRCLEILADATDVVMLHMKIAFADITDFIEFGQKQVPLIGAFGPVKDAETGEKIMLDVPTVRFRESSEVDGQLISKVSNGKGGATVQLADRQKSLAFLERYFELNPADVHKAAYDKGRLEIERQRMEIEAAKSSAPDDNDVTVTFEDADAEVYGE